MEDLEIYLKHDAIFNYTHEKVQRILASLNLDGLDEIEKAKKLFCYVRDSIPYSVKITDYSYESFAADKTLEKEHSYCIPKAIALATLGRAVGIPSRIHFANFLNHRLAPYFVELWGTNCMAMHCYTEFYLNDKWVKATPALDKATCERHSFKIVEFDGIHDSMLHSTDIYGNPHVEYTKDHGAYAEFPYEKIIAVWEETYGLGNLKELLKKVNDGSNEEFV